MKITNLAKRMILQKLFSDVAPRYEERQGGIL